MGGTELAPHPYFLIESMRCIGYTLDTALADVIDNSITADASKISVRFAWNEGNPWLAILDDGHGMSEKELHEAMRFGGGKSPTETRDAKDLGRFGLGMKTASLSQCDKMTVISKQNEEINTCVWDMDVFKQQKEPKWYAQVPDIKTLEKDTTIKPILNELKSQKSGTIVFWQSMNKGDC